MALVGVPMTETSNRQSGEGIVKSKSAASKSDHHAPAEWWLRPQLDRERLASPATNSTAELLLLVWSCLLFAFISSFFADDMARWLSGPDPMPPLP